jgi:hypothetical protein
VPVELTAEGFVADLVPFVPAGLGEEFESVASSLDDGMGNGDAIRAGIRTGTVFGLAKEYIDLPPEEIVRLLQSPVHDVRVGAVSIMGKQFVRKKTPDSRREELYDMYLAWTRRIDTWSLVDVSGHQVVGGWLVDKPRDVLYELMTLRRIAWARSGIETPYSTTTSRSTAGCFSPTSTATPCATLGPDEPGMRSRIEPNARAAPPPSLYTPDTSRVAIPAIFWTTLSAIDVFPCEETSSAAGGRCRAVDMLESDLV